MRKKVLEDLDRELKEAGLRTSEEEEAPPSVEIENSAVPVAIASQFDPKMFAEAIGMAFAQQIPVIAKLLKEQGVDPEKERIKQMRRKQQRQDQEAARTADVDKWLRCDHMRTHPYSGTARIGWATQSDGITRGVCMGCGCPFSPIATELPDPKRMSHLFDKYKNVPTSIARNDFLNGMVVAGNPA
jgi:hypothetical protein